MEQKLFFPKKKNVILTFLFFLFFMPAFSQSNFFCGVKGGFNFPFNAKSDRSYGFGGGFEGSFGYSFGMFDASAKLAYSGTKGKQLIISSNEFLFGIAGGVNLDYEIIPFLPEIMGIRAEVSLFGDVFKINHYRTQQLKDRDLFDISKGFTVLPAISLSVYFPDLLEIKDICLTPVAGWEIYFHIDKSGVMPSNQLYIGVKMNLPEKLFSWIKKTPEVEVVEEEEDPDSKLPNDVIIMFHR